MKASAFKTLAILSGILGVGCAQRSGPQDTGDLRLAVVLPNGTTITTITCQVLSSSSANIIGPVSFDVADPQATISLDLVVPVTPTGDPGDHIQLSATDSIGESCTGTSPPFQVVAGTHTAVTLMLLCGGVPSNGTGSLGVTATVTEADHCPSIASAVVSPAQTAVGGEVSAVVTASEPDGGEFLTYTWEPSENFLNLHTDPNGNTFPESPSVTYVCTAFGTQSLSVTVTDSHVPPCSTTATLYVDCGGSSSDAGLSCSSDAGAGSWQQFGTLLGAVSGSSSAGRPAMALLPDGRPLVAYTGPPYTASNAGQTYIDVWPSVGCDGTWQPMGAPLASGEVAALVLPAGSDQPLLALEADDAESFVVERWNGTAFEALGAPFQPSNRMLNGGGFDRYVGSVAMVADANGNPILAWVDDVSGTDPVALAAQWNGSSWVMLSPTTGLGSVGGAEALSMAIAPDGLPVLAWPSRLSTTSVVAKFVSGTTWTLLGAPPTSEFEDVYEGPVVRINSAGDTFLITNTRPTNNMYQLSVAQFDGTTWQPLGGPLAPSVDESYYDMTFDRSGAQFSPPPSSTWPPRRARWRSFAGTAPSGKR